MTASELSLLLCGAASELRGALHMLLRAVPDAHLWLSLSFLTGLPGDLQVGAVPPLTGEEAEHQESSALSEASTGTEPQSCRYQARLASRQSCLLMHAVTKEGHTG